MTLTGCNHGVQHYLCCCFAEDNPALARWGDVLFTSAIGTMYRAAQLDAVATVAETWADTAIRLALYLSPLVSRQH